MKLIKPKLLDFSLGYQDDEMIEKLKNICGTIQSPREELATRVLGGMSRLLCLSSNYEEGMCEMDMENLSESAKRLVKSMSLFTGEERCDTAEDELVDLYDCDDEDICLNTIAYYRFISIDSGATPYIGEALCALVGKWLHGLLSKKIHSVIIETLKMTTKLSALKVYLKLGDTVKTSSILTLDSFVPDPNAFNFKPGSIESSKCNFSDWIPPIYSRGAICSIALKAFECLCMLSTQHVNAYAHIFTCQERIMEKVFCYLFGSWTEEEWKAIFPGSKFFGANCSDIYSSGGANFQRMIDGLFCEEKSIQKMIKKFQICAVMFIRCWLEKQTNESISRCMRGDIMRRIAFLLCDSDNDKMKLEASKALLNGWACLSSSARIRPLHVNVYREDARNYSCLPQSLRRELKAILAEACEEEGVIDMLNAHFAHNLSEDIVTAQKDERIRRRLNAKCDPNICPVCALFADADLDYNEMGREDKKENEKRVKDTKAQFDDNLESKFKGEELFAFLKDCLDACEMSSNEYSKIRFNYSWSNYYYVNDEDVEEVYEESENEDE
ncbi:uncharacterized protein MONOS_7576 [Monocercomonoides exilis]|uniref:uncharacterized protein n=1 Tax=Monocercomonoides exilis TaxID=2049356 RepID=UPI00355A7613|nr:hypothetical protein MONOS_7576 [Monocercomonoides exilis]|eukprot:MONOS_7576.1-p1 / transcript=MONOS_7576.1 / gene=MONOS_7576 / organism=Monocercomonoides_exilis_PA203 / gene_product=unspecified product / transcript_product=unspecified product / location=Mono_scaffold00262:21586-23331(+) / protein_length=555 / sequence_SO=supercontig / SO=protein_coding / is_pseudo=false